MKVTLYEFDNEKLGFKITLSVMGKFYCFFAHHRKCCVGSTRKITTTASIIDKY